MFDTVRNPLQKATLITSGVINLRTTKTSPPQTIPSFGKCSLKVSLVLVGTAGLTGCGDSDTGTRYEYANRTDCVKDWGETECPPQSRNGGHGGSYIFYRAGGYNNNYKATHAKSVTRGGFGSMASGSRGG